MTLDITRTLTKHIAAIHNSASLNSTQRKVMNIFLENALRDSFESKIHRISLTRLLRDLGWSSNSKATELLKSDLKELAKIQIEWNVLNVDRKNKWIAMQLLAEVGLENGEITYAYPPTLKELLFNPNIYAKLDLDIQKLLGTRYAVALWELLSGEFSIKQQTTVKTSWIKYESLLKIFGLSNSVYEYRYADFINKVLEPSIKDVSLKSNFQVSFELNKESRKIAHIKFCAHKKEGEIENEVPTITNFRAEELKARLESLGFSTRFINTITAKYSVDQIEVAIDTFKNQLKKGKINYPTSFFKKSLDEGWGTSEQFELKALQSEQSSKILEQTNLVEEIDNLDETETIKALRADLLKTIGEAPYTSWIHPLKFRQDDKILMVMAPTAFNRDWVENHYRQDIISTATKCFGESKLTVEFILINEKGRVLA